MKPIQNLTRMAAALVIALGLPGLALAQSTNADLSGLAISSGTLDPVFDSAITSYTASPTVASITITPTADDALATITVNGDPVDSGDPSNPVSLSVGPNTITIVVTAEDEATTKTYTLTVTPDFPALPGPVAYWPMRDGTPGQTVPTGSGNAAENIIDIANTFVNGTVNNANSTWEADPLRGIVWSTTELNRMTAGTQGIDLNDGFTWSLWVNADVSNITDSGADSIMGTRQGSPWHKIDLTSTSNWNGAVPSSGSYPNLARSEWIHIAYVGHSSFGRRIYVDGELVASNATTSSSTFNGALEIGGTSNFNEDVTGLYSDVAIWNQALTVEQIESLVAGANVIEDTTAPVIAASSPPNEDAEATVVNGLLAIFDEPVTIGSGEIRIYDSTGPTLVATIDVTDATQVSATGAGILIDPSVTLDGGTTYYIEMDAGVVKNASNLDFAGFTGSTTWSFTVDNLPPTVVSFGDEYNGTSFGENLSSLEFIVTFNEAIDGSSVSAADFGNAGDAIISIGTVTQVAPEVFTVEVLPTSTGTLQLSILSGSVILDLSGNALDTTAAILSDTITTITSGNTGAVTITGTTGGGNSWNTATNWSGNFVTKDVWGAIIAPGVTAQVQDTATLAYSGGLTLGSGSQLWINNAAGSQNALGTGPITFQGSTIRMTLNVTPVNFPALVLNGDATFTTGGNTEDNKTRNLTGGVSGTGDLTFVGRNNLIWNFNAASTFVGNMHLQAVDRHRVFFNAADAAAVASITVTPRTTDDRSAMIVLGANDVFSNATTLTLNGRGGNNSGNPYIGYARINMQGFSATVDKLFIDDVQMPAGDYVSVGDNSNLANPLNWIAGTGTLTVLSGPGSPPTLDSITDDQDGGPVETNTLITYTLTFSKDMDGTTIEAADFGNEGSSSISVGAINEVTPTVFTVVVTPTTAGTLRLRINEGAVIEAADATILDTTSALLDDTTITVEDPAPPSNPFDDWADGTDFGDDTSGDGISNGMAFLLGAGEPGENALGLLPTSTEDGGDLVLAFSMRNADSRGGATLSVEYGSDLSGWTTVQIPDVEGETIVGEVTFNITLGNPLNSVTASISSEAEDGGKLFARLSGVIPAEPE
ncbi:MAG: cadherin-like beta sandwich domain-containing protein [Luteolibacter sp.]